MLDFFAQNNIGGEAIVWLIIAFFWVIAQLFSRAKEKQKGREPAEQEEAKPSSPQEQEQSFEANMRQFLENLGAEPAEEEEPDEPAPAPRRRQQQRSAQQTARRSDYTRPDEAPLRPVAVDRTSSLARDDLTQQEPDDPDLGRIDASIGEEGLDTEQAYAIREIREEGFSAYLNPRDLLVNLNHLRMNIPIIPITGLSTTDQSRGRPAIHGRGDLRQAITSQLILSNPLAMGEDKGSYTKRIV